MKKTFFKLSILVLLFSFTVPLSAQSSAGNPLQSDTVNADNWKAVGENVNKAFYFVVDKIIDLQVYFIWYSKGIGRVVFLIAVLSAALNHALTGSGLKDNLIKIFKATIFFWIIIFSYPSIIGWITKTTWDMADNSIRDSVESYFNTVVDETTYNYQNSVSIGGGTYYGGVGVLDDGLNATHHANTAYYTYYRQVTVQTTMDNLKLFNDLAATRPHPRMGEYTTIAPAALIKVLIFIAADCLDFADNTERNSAIPDFSRILKGLICAFFIIATGIFSLIEYLVCFLEFAFVSSVGVILLPFSIWDGSKFLTEGFIKAIVGFFMKLLICSLAIFLMIYGFISIFYTFHQEGFSGTPDQIVFVAFSSLLFFFICKSAPGIAQALLSGSPSLSATGAISAVTGAVGGVMAAGRLAKNVVSTASKTGSSVVGGVGGSLLKAGSAGRSVLNSGGHIGDAFAAGAVSIGSDIVGGIKTFSGGLARSALSGSFSKGFSGAAYTPNDSSNPEDLRQNTSQSRNKNFLDNQTFGHAARDRISEGKAVASNYMNFVTGNKKDQK